MAIYYPSLKINVSSPGSNDVYAGNGLVLFVGKTGATNTAAVSALTNAGTSKYVIPLNPGANTFWFSSTAVKPYMAYLIVRPEGYTSTAVVQIDTGSTVSVPAGGQYSTKYPTTGFIDDLWLDRQQTTSSWLSDIDEFETYEDQKLAQFADITGRNLVYGTGTTIWTSAQAGSRYTCCSRLGFKSNWSTGFATYYTSKPATYTGYTVNVSTTTVNLQIYDGVTGYGSHSISNIRLYAVSTGGTRTALLNKLSASNITPGTTTNVIMDRSTSATIQGVKRLELDFGISVGNGITVIDFECAGYSGQVDYEIGSFLTTVVLSDLQANLTISNGMMFDMQLN